ncbi:hypothetical protein GALL_554430 [mine drainage metagenome]|uniref:Uncharacterized protein n=1 Tax=mine drainage metagenome TaxID=410659 RepID=A0A1J5NWC2_9ZZZZ
MESSSSELKPYSVVRYRLSTPPTTAQSINPAAIMRCALAKALALDEQADDTTMEGPRSPKRTRA